MHRHAAVHRGTNASFQLVLTHTPTHTHKDRSAYLQPVLAEPVCGIIPGAEGPTLWICFHMKSKSEKYSCQTNSDILCGDEASFRSSRFSRTSSVLNRHVTSSLPSPFQKQISCLSLYTLFGCIKNPNVCIREIKSL